MGCSGARKALTNTLIRWTLPEYAYRNPYLLSNMVGAGLALVSLPLVLLFIQNTTSGKAGWSSWCSFFTQGGSGNGIVGRGDDGGDGYALRAAKTDTDGTAEVEACGTRIPSWMQPATMPLTTKGNVQTNYSAERLRREEKETKPDSLLAQRHIVALLVMEAVFSVAYCGLDEVYALWALSSASKGGLEWSSQLIGQVFFVCGLMVLLFELLCVPYLTPWLGVRLSQRLGSVCEVPVYFVFPLLSRINGGGLPVTISALVLLFMSYVCKNSFYVGAALAINTAPGPDRRGELNGISAMITAVTKSVSPIVSAALFAYSINGNQGLIINHHLVFSLLGLMRLTAAYMGWNRITDNGNME